MLKYRGDTDFGVPSQREQKYCKDACIITETEKLLVLLCKKGQ